MQPPHFIGKYEIVDELGAGAIGTVYRAYDPTLERIVAVKLLHPHLQEVSAGEYGERLRIEAGAVARLNHPAIVAIFDYDDRDPAGPYIAMLRRPPAASAPPVTSAPPAPSAPLAASAPAARWSPEQLAELERQLARIVGPLAKVLVRNAAANAADRHGLYGLLAEHLNSPEERRRFLAGEPGVTVDPSATLPPVPEAAAAVVAAAPAVVPGGRPLTPDMLVRATQLLAKYLGPVASVMIKKAAQTAADESHLYSMLADKLADPAQRQRFPREAEGGQSAAQLCAKPG